MFPRYLRRIGLIVAGVLLISWGATSAFADYNRANLPVDPLDNPDSSNSIVYYPTAVPGVTGTNTPFSPQTLAPTGSPSAMVPTDTGEAQAFSAPYKSPTPGPTNTPQPTGMVPERIVIPAIKLDAPIAQVGYTLINQGGNVFQQWLVPNEYAAGWLSSSALLGLPGNTVLDGHHNEFGEVFRRLVDLKQGDVIYVYSGDYKFKYTVTNTMILPERDQPLSVRFQNAQWIMPSQDERLTLVTCWPHTSNTHRQIIVAAPAGKFGKNDPA